MTQNGPPQFHSPLFTRRVGDPDAPPLLLLHGITGSSRYWERAVKALKEDYRLLIPDLPGFGQSPKPDVDYRLPVHVDALERYLEEEGVSDRPIAILGHSLGTLVALEYLARHPEAFDRMILMSLPRHLSREEAHRLFLANSVNYRRILGVNDFMSCVRSAKEVGATVFLQYLTKFPYEVIRDSSKFTLRSLLTTLEHCLLDYRVDEVLEKIPALDVLMIHGVMDKVAPVENAKPVAERYGWEIDVIENTGHHVFLTHSRHCLKKIRRFLEPYRQAASVAVTATEPSAGRTVAK